MPTTEAIQAIADLTGADPNAIYQTLADDPDVRLRLPGEGGHARRLQEGARHCRSRGCTANLHPARTYPSGAIAGNLVGFIGTDGPQAGTEIAEERLPRRPPTARSTYESSADGVRLPGIDHRAAAGDRRRHDPPHHRRRPAVVRAAGPRPVRHGARSGLRDARWSCEVKTGRIMAAADWPSVDPNDVERRRRGRPGRAQSSRPRSSRDRS